VLHGQRRYMKAAKNSAEYSGSLEESVRTLDTCREALTSDSLFWLNRAHLVKMRNVR